MEGQLRKLRSGTHPKTGEPLPPAIELGPATLPIRVSTNEVEHKPPDGFYIYKPLARPPAIAVVPAEGQSCSDRQAARLDRIRAKELATSLRHVVISDDVPHCATDDDKDISLMPNDAVASGARVSPPYDGGGGVWEYLFPDEQQRGLGAFGCEEASVCSSGTGSGELHSRGRCAPTARRTPGSSVIASADCRGGEAPPEGRPSEHDDADTMDHDDGMDEGITEAGSTLRRRKCKGKYRILEKGTARHGHACCLGT